MSEREERRHPLARVDRIDGDAERTALPRAEGKEGAALEASADDAFFSRVCAVGGADAAIDVHSALYARRTGGVKDKTPSASHSFGTSLKEGGKGMSKLRQLLPPSCHRRPRRMA